MTFRIHTKAGAVVEHQVHKEIAPISARKDLVGNMKSEKAKMEGKSAFSYGIDKVEARKNFRNWEKTYEKSCPETLSVESKNAMWKKAKAIKDKFLQGMLSRDELHPVKQLEVNGTIVVVVDEERIRALNSVHREATWLKINQKLISEFKNIMRHLCPDNPGAADIERFRPMRRGRK